MSDSTPTGRQSIGIVGIGLIGGSIGLALRNPSREVIGWDVSKTAQTNAVTRQCVDRVASFEEVAQCDVVFLGVPPLYVVESAERVESAKRPETVVSDCSSVKTEVSAWAEKGKHAQFVPGHPMAGHEKSGCEFASAWLFRNARWILTPNRHTSKAALQAIQALVKEMGAQPIRLDPSEHDHHVALLSHVPHVLAALLVLKADELENVQVGAGSWRDLTRVGGVEPKLWSQILFENRTELGKVLASFRGEIERIEELLNAEDRSGLEVWLMQARDAKDRQIRSTAESMPSGAKKMRKKRI